MLYYGESIVKGIMEPYSASSLATDVWYTLDGRRLSGKPAQKGIYITNGQKVVVK